MADIVEVIKGLDDIQKHLDTGYSYAICWNSELIRDAIALLKEYEVKTHGADSGMCEICSFYERAMPVKPHYNARTNWYECGACHYSMTSGMHCRCELIPAYKVGFCAKCGKAVTWE